MKTNESNLNEMVSTIVRIHDENGFWQLKEAILSLSNQEYKNVQLIVCAQNASIEFLIKIGSFIKDTWNYNGELQQRGNQIAIGKHLISSVSTENQVDGRCLLLREGISLATGRYLAFLDYDDVLYPNAYALLTKQLIKTKSALVAGGCTKAICEIYENEQIKFLHKESFLEKSSRKNQMDLFYGNFLPIHSYIIDLNHVSKDMIKFNDNVPLFEDYQIILHLACKFRFDLQLLSTSICEYRLRTNGSNSVNFGKLDPEKESKWNKAQSYIEDLKNNLTINVSLKEISDLIQEKEMLKSQLGIFRKTSYIVLRKIYIWLKVFLRY